MLAILSVVGLVTLGIYAFVLHIPTAIVAVTAIWPFFSTIGAICVFMWWKRAHAQLQQREKD